MANFVIFVNSKQFANYQPVTYEVCKLDAIWLKKKFAAEWDINIFYFNPEYDPTTLLIEVKNIVTGETTII